jgi:sugar/nucleoside kinase (ribokinase family)
MSAKAVVIGDLLMDYQYWVRACARPGSDEAILAAEANPGGSAANTAAGLCAQGVETALISRVGDDDLGRELAARMEKAGVGVSLLERHGGTGYTVTLVDPAGERTMYSYRNSAGHAPRLTAAMRKAIRGAGALCVSGYMLQEKAQAAFLLEAAQAAKACGCRVAFDPSPVVWDLDKETVAALLALTDIVLPNRDELRALSGAGGIDAGLEAMLEKAPCVAVKLGGEGSRLAALPGFCAPCRCEARVQRISPLDTTGAGDSFNAGFIAAFLRGESPEGWLESGNRLAARAIARRGGR